jgi:hypothetical protein
MESSNSTGMLRDSVRELLALAAQRQSRMDMINRSEPVMVTCMVCLCVVEACKFGRRRLTCSAACRTRLWRKRRAERVRLLASSDGCIDPVAAGWDPAARRWRSREAFEAWWAAKP